MGSENGVDQELKVICKFLVLFEMLSKNRSKSEPEVDVRAKDVLMGRRY
jgi:hypothetical protein